MIVNPGTVANEALQYAYGALLACGSTGLNRVHVAAGLVAWDDCCGMLVAAPERVFRTARFPTEGPDENGCFDGLIAVNVVVVLVRCVPVLDDLGNPPTVVELNAAYLALLNEAAVVWNALSGSWPSEWVTSGLQQSYTGAEGGCIAAETRIIIGVPQEQFCPTCEEQNPD